MVVANFPLHAIGGATTDGYCEREQRSVGVTIVVSSTWGGGGQ